jgi:hypothetical protein
MIFRSLLVSALLTSLAGCDGAEIADPGEPNPPGNPPVNPPANPPTGPGFSVLTFLHGSQSSAQAQVRDVAVDPAGNIYVTGGTSDRNFPVTPNAYQKSFGRGQSSTSTGSLGNWDVFVMKFAADGQLIWSTLLGGGNYDRAYALEVDGTGVYVAGRAGAGFPTTAGVIQPGFAGDNIPSAAYGQQDGFITKLSLDGSALLWSTYFGSNADDTLRDIAVGPDGDVYPAVSVAKASYPYITPGAYQTTNRGQADGAVCRLDSRASSVRWCTYVGGSLNDGMGPSVRLDGAGNVYYLQAVSSPNAPVTTGAVQPAHGGGIDQHLSKFSPQGALIFATYFGGSGGEGGETHNLWVTANGESYIAAGTNSANLPTTNGALRRSLSGANDAFVARISSDGRQLLAATYIGGSGTDAIQGVGFDGDGNIVVSGGTSSSDFPGLAGAPQSAKGGGEDGFIAILPPSLGSARATFIGGRGNDFARAVAVDASRSIVYAGGITASSDFPTNASSFLRQYSGGEDAFLAGWRLR